MAWTFSGTVLDGATGEYLVVGTGEPEELPGRYAVAGLVDAHAHPTVATDEHGPYLANGEYGAARLDEYAASGVTVIRDTGGRGQVTLGFARTAAAGRPVVTASGRFIAPVNRYFPRRYGTRAVNLLHGEVFPAAKELAEAVRAADAVTVERDAALRRAADANADAVHLNDANSGLGDALVDATAGNERLKTAITALADKWDAAAVVPADVADDPDAYDGIARAMWDLRARLYRNHAAAVRKLAGRGDEAHVPSAEVMKLLRNAFFTGTPTASEDDWRRYCELIGPGVAEKYGEWTEAAP